MNMGETTPTTEQSFWLEEEMFCVVSVNKTFKARSNLTVIRKLSVKSFVIMAGAGAIPFVDKKLAQRKVMLFSKSYVPECKEVKSVLEEFGMGPTVYEAVEIEKRQDVNQIENYFQVLCLTDNRAVPQLFVNQRYVGGHEEIMRMHGNGKLKKILIEAQALP